MNADSFDMIYHFDTANVPEQYLNNYTNVLLRCSAGRLTSFNEIALFNNPDESVDYSRAIAIATRENSIYANNWNILI